MTTERVHSSKVRDDPRHGGESAKGSRERGKIKHDMVTIKERIKVVIQNLKLFCKRVEKQIKVEIARILPYFSREDDGLRKSN